MALHVSLRAQTPAGMNVRDTLKTMKDLDEVAIKATRATVNSATTFRNMNKAEIAKNNLGQDLPYLLNQTPSVVVSSDAGAGVGYTGLRIRGSDGSRINVTINGIPLNDAESQGSFFINLPDFASSVDNIQVQRGVGTSTNGAGAFGASLNIQTTTLRDSAYAELNNTFGSYNTWKNTVNVGTGLINNRFTFDGRLSRIRSDGYIDRASSNLKSFFMSGAYYGKRDLVRANVFSGTEKTYQAWNGVAEELLKTDRTHNDFTYENQTDNYSQDHYQLFHTHTFSNKFTSNFALHYTHGEGYYEEYKEDQTLAGYGINPVMVGGTTVTRSDLVRRLWLDNDFYGLTYSFNYTLGTKLAFTLGGGYNEYKGKHFDEVTWAQYANYDASTSARHRYNDNDAVKTDFNTFGKISYHIGSMDLFADLQFRRITYSFLGFDRNKNNIQQQADLNFFNPKLGATYALNERSNIYASFSVGNKEPNRNDYTESTPDSRPHREHLNDLEAGYRLAGTKVSAGVNAFGMFYKDQLVVTGKLNDVGAQTRQNVPHSYRAGIELDGRWMVTKRLSWAATASLSRNKVRNYTEYINDDAAPIVKTFGYKNTDLAFSPAFIGSSELSWTIFNGTGVALLSKYVSKQYLDNTASETRILPSFFVNDVRLSRTASFKGIKNIGISLSVNNVFNTLYENNGYTYSGLSGGVVYRGNGYYPQATRNFLAALSLKF
ncbi:TonB-dependent receptor [Pedobacter sp. HMF7056]|uniref:TonB-dependent receptor n=2 Tax=Hufsiella ginkgonis TaxID=2695274 RepID=A0A7K1XVY2_9SPHI|nr:TonB-dependent receptor [Hufsiella ginkgonis]MXV14968.1 TonB-dependent receptor [Hufsiella ginkgonis]